MLDCSWHAQGVYYAYLDCIVQYLVRIRSVHIKYAYLSVFDLYFHTYLNVFDKYVKIHSRYTQIHATKTVCIWSFANTHRIRIDTRIYANTLKYALNTQATHSPVRDLDLPQSDACWPGLGLKSRPAGRDLPRTWTSVPADGAGARTSSPFSGWSEPRLIT